MLVITGWLSQPADNNSVEEDRLYLLTHCMTSIVHDINALTVERSVELCGIHIKNLKLYVLSLYRSPSGDFDTFLDTLNEALNFIGWKNRVVIAGDFNVHFGTNSHECVDLCGMLQSFGFYQMIVDATRGENCLDNIFVNFEYGDCEVCQHDMALSDHRAQVIDIPVLGVVKKPERTSFLCRPITGMGKLKFFSLVESINWNFLNEAGISADDKFSLFLELIMKAYNDSFPEKTYYKRNNQNRTTHWFSEGLKNMRETLNFLNDLYKKYPTLDLRSLIKTHKYNYRTAIKNAKRKANDSMINNATNPVKCMWDIINEHRGITRKGCSESSISPDQFNNFFATIALDIVANIDPSDIDPVESMHLNSPETFSFQEITFNEVR